MSRGSQDLLARNEPLYNKGTKGEEELSVSVLSHHVSFYFFSYVSYRFPCLFICSATWSLALQNTLFCLRRFPKDGGSFACHVSSRRSRPCMTDASLDWYTKCTFQSTHLLTGLNSYIKANQTTLTYTRRDSIRKQHLVVSGIMKYFHLISCHPVASRRIGSVLLT